MTFDSDDVTNGITDEMDEDVFGAVRAYDEVCEDWLAEWWPPFETSELYGRLARKHQGGNAFGAVQEATHLTWDHHHVLPHNWTGKTLFQVLTLLVPRFTVGDKEEFQVYLPVLKSFVRFMKRERAMPMADGVLTILGALDPKRFVNTCLDRSGWVEEKRMVMDGEDHIEFDDAMIEDLMARTYPGLGPTSHLTPQSRSSRSGLSRLPSSTPMTYRLKISLNGIRPPIWRRVEVPGRFNLSEVHGVIQAVMGWMNCHLHAFTVDGREIAPDEDGYPPEEENEIRLDELGLAKGARFRYEYDFGDSWIHTVVVEDVFDEDADHAVCLKGKRACPPEDCGGTWGYHDLVEVVTKPIQQLDEEHRQRLEWAGHFDPEEFDLDDVNEALRDLDGYLVTMPF